MHFFAPNVTLSGGYVTPFGIGPGVNGTIPQEGDSANATAFSGPWQQFGNYTLVSGTTLTAMPAGAKDAHSFGGSGESNMYGGYGAANASWEINVPGTSTDVLLLG